MMTRRPTGTLLLLALLLANAAGCTTTGGRVSSWGQPKRNTPTERLWFYAQQSEADGRLNDAARAYGELYRRNPNQGEYAHRLGVVFTLLGEDARAQNAYARARQINPNNPELLIDMGYAAYLKNDYAQAEELLKSALTLSPGNSRATSNLALAIGFQARDEECLALFQQVHGTDQIEPLCNLAFIQSERGDLGKAIETYQRVLELDPQAKKATVALSQLKSAKTGKPDSTAKDSTVKQVAASAPLENQSENRPVPEEAEDTKPAPVAAAPATDWMQDEAAPEAPPVTLAAVEPADQQTPVVPTGNLAAAATNPAPAELPIVAPKELRPVTGQPIVSSPRRLTKTATSKDAPLAVVVEPAAVAAPKLLPPEEPASQIAPDEPFAWADSNAENEAHSPKWLQERLQQIVTRRGRTGFMGFCPVALRDEQKLVDVNPEFRMEYQSQSYEFSSSEALQKFAEQPERYLAAAGGSDVVSISQGTLVAQGSLEYALWFRHKLYLFENEQHKELFRAQCRQFAVDF